MIPIGGKSALRVHIHSESEKKDGSLVLKRSQQLSRASQVVLLVKTLPAIAGDLRGMGSIPGSGRFPGGRQGNPLQYSCLENPMDRGDLWATVHSLTTSRTQLKQLSMHTHTAVVRATGAAGG